MATHECPHCGQAFTAPGPGTYDCPHCMAPIEVLPLPEADPPSKPPILAPTARGLSPTRQLFAVCRSLTADGELSVDEAWLLADWLNHNPEACECWPGDELAELLSQAFADGKISVGELRALGRKLVAIEKKASKIEAAEDVDLAIEGFDSSFALLPSVPVVVQVPSSSGSGRYSVDLGVASCTCPDWAGHRSRRKPLDLGRCCKHVALALSKVAGRDGWPAWLGAVVSDCRSRSGGLNPLDSWHVCKVRDREVLFSVGSGPWCNVYAQREDYWTRFGYNREEDRWSYGDRPYLSRTIAEAIQAAA